MPIVTALPGFFGKLRAEVSPIRSTIGTDHSSKSRIGTKGGSICGRFVFPAEPALLDLKLFCSQMGNDWGLKNHERDTMDLFIHETRGFRLNGFFPSPLVCFASLWQAMRGFLCAAFGRAKAKCSLAFSFFVLLKLGVEPKIMGKPPNQQF